VQYTIKRLQDPSELEALYVSDTIFFQAKTRLSNKTESTLELRYMKISTERQGKPVLLSFN